MYFDTEADTQERLRRIKAARPKKHYRVSHKGLAFSILAQDLEEAHRMLESNLEDFEPKACTITLTKETL